MSASRVDVHLGGYIMMYQSLVVSQTVFYRDCLVISAVSQERYRSMFCHLFLERIPSKHLFSLIFPEQVLTGTLVSVFFMHGDDRVDQYREVRSCNLVYKEI